MAGQLVAQSISRTVWELVERGERTARVEAVFRRACVLRTSGGEAIGLVLGKAGDGPLNVVVDAAAEALSALEPGMPARIESAQLRVGPLEIDLQPARVWEARPNWDGVRVCALHSIARYFSLQHLAMQSAPAGTLLPPLTRSPDRVELENTAADATSTPILGVVREALGPITAGWRGGLDSLRAGAAQMAGLGGGLTPAGDDFLMGVMLAAWLLHPRPEELCAAVVEAAEQRTSWLSAAFLWAAARGECGLAWHQLLAALCSGDESDLDRTVQLLMSRGATSGADALAGFLRAGLIHT